MSQAWNRPEREVTPESARPSRRRWLRAAGLGGVALACATGGGLWWWFRGGKDDEVLAAGRFNMPALDHYPAAYNSDFQKLRGAVTSEVETARYCNFYEFSSSKNVWRWVHRFQPVPWRLEVGGLVARPRTFDLEDLVRAFPLEERIYRHRCVEAWAMVVPWTGFPLAALLRQVEPLPEARYVRFTSFHRPAEASHQSAVALPWPYTEGLTLAEAANELAFLATGLYGHPLLKQNGAPVRLVVPWKYGFKSAKSIVRIDLTAEQPATFWNTLVPHEYDFWANVNPAVPHPRWSQAQERMLGTGDVRPTELYNGYASWVANLYPS
jgi:sulfoxide reductase catalytic subunit YedY